LIGRAKSATMRTMDVVGLDTFMAVARNTALKAPNDPYKDWFIGPKWTEELVEQGHHGQKTPHKGGCYKKEGKEILAYRPDKKAYEPQSVQTFPWSDAAKKEKDLFKRLALILEQDDAGAQLVWRALRDVMAYSALLLDEIAGGLPKPVDDAVKWGYNWE